MSFLFSLYSPIRSGLITRMCFPRCCRRFGRRAKQHVHGGSLLCRFDLVLSIPWPTRRERQRLLVAAGGYMPWIFIVCGVVYRSSIFHRVLNFASAFPRCFWYYLFYNVLTPFLPVCFGTIYSKAHPEGTATPPFCCRRIRCCVRLERLGDLLPGEKN